MPVSSDSWCENGKMLSQMAVCLLLCLVTAVGEAQEPHFRSQSNVVLVPVLVRDAHGNIMYGLRANDFVVRDDGVPQKVELDDAEDQVTAPVSVLVAVQTGRRARREFARIRGLASMLLPLLDQEGSQIGLVAFDSHIHLVQPFSRDGNLLRTDLAPLKPGDNGAAVLDVVAYATRLLQDAPAGHQRIVLLISETRDHGSSTAKVDEVVKSLGDTNTVLYALPFSPSLSQVLDTERGSNKDEWRDCCPDLWAPLVMTRQAFRRNATKAMASLSGGEYELFKSRSGFEADLTDFTNHLHNRYMLSFQPKDPHPGPHRIEVSVLEPPEATVLARTMYWAVDTHVSTVPSERK
jgi:VWFA-related protein